MDIKVEALEGNRVKVDVAVDAATVDRCIKKAYKDLAFKYNFPGFRKGKAPRKVIDNALGAEFVLASVTEDLVNDTYPLVIEEKRFSPMGAPEFDEKMAAVEAGKPFEFFFTVELKAEIELTSYEPVEIEIPAEGASEAEIDEQIDALREHYTELEDGNAATKVKRENTVDLTMKVTDEEGNEIDNLSSESRLFAFGNGMFPEAFGENILGMKKGESKEFTIEVPADDASILMGSYAGKKVNFEVTCNVVKKKVVPALTEEWAKDVMGFEGIEDLRARIAESIIEQKESIIPRMKENACLMTLLERFEGEAPAALVEEAESRLLQNFFTQLQNSGLSFDAYLVQQGLTADQFKADVKMQATDDVKQDLALDAWARHFGIEATDEEVSVEFAIAGLENAKETEEEWRKAGRLYLIREGIVRTKAARNILDTAIITEMGANADAE